MPHCKMLVMSQPVPGREAEYNDWYQNVHLAQVVVIKGIRSAQRFRLARSLVEGEAHPYAAICEIETDGIDSVLQEIRNVAGSEHLIISDALATDLTRATIYETFGPAVHSDRQL